METMYMICAIGGGAVLVIQTVLLLLGGDTDAGGSDIHGGFDAGGLHHDFGMDAGGHDVGQDVGHDVGQDVGHEVGHSDAYQASYLKVLSFKTLVAFFTFFGLGGLASRKSGLEPGPTMLIALGAGLAALYVVAYLMSMLFRLQSRGNINLANAVGQTGKVYLRIPEKNSGTGKVNVMVQGRLVECKARTTGTEIPTGAEVKVVGVVGSNTLDVLPVGKE